MLTREDLETLLVDAASPAVSAFLPTHVAGREIRQDSIRLRNLLDQAQERLGEGMRRTEAADLLKPAYDLVHDGAFWRHQAQGLAVFLNGRHMVVHKVPTELPETVFVDDRFHVRPLLPLLTADGRYIVLTLTQRDAHLYEGSRHGLVEVPVAQLPRGMENLFTVPDAMGEAVERPDDRTTRKPVTANSSDAVAYAESGSQQLTTNEEVVQYVTQIARSLEQWLGGSGTPLVLAADERVAGHYKRVNRYPDLVEPAIQEHPASLSLDELHRRAYDVVRPSFEQRRADALDRYRMVAGDGSGLGIADPAQVVEAAVTGRVDRLFLREGAEVWGRWLDDSSRAVTHHGRKDGDRELMEFAAAQVFMKGGRIYQLASDAMPGDSPMAASLRF